MRASPLSWLLLGTSFPTQALAETVVHDNSFIPDHVLRVTHEQVSVAYESRMSVTVNGTTPGPVIRLLPGAVSWIRVYNDMQDQNLTMHWHGLAQRMAPFADGTPQASQWPIPPGRFFDYEIATENDDAGTYFYHSHVQMQAMTCSGPLIVDDCGTSPYTYDDERIFYFQDYVVQTGGENTSEVSSMPLRSMDETKGLILNGKGVAQGKTATTSKSAMDRGLFGSWRAGASGNGPVRRVLARDTDQVEPSDDCTLPIIDVEPGKAYRFRFIGGTGVSYLSFGFEGHDNLTIVQVDGSEYNAPVTVGHLQLGSGQRFDLLFKTKTVEELEADGNKSTYFLQFETREHPNPYRGYGVLRYNPAANIPVSPANPVINLPEKVDEWLEYTLQPLFPEMNQAPSASEVTRRIVIDCDLLQDNKTGEVVWELAHLSWTEFTYQSPVLVDIYKHGQSAIPDFDAAQKNNGWDPKTLSFPAKVGEVLEIVLQNTGAQVGDLGSLLVHPFHAHGQHYYDIGSGKGQYDADANNAKMEMLGYKPVRRDTTMLFRYEDTVKPGEVAGWRAWRIRVTDPGVWMIHCHILGHMMMGMQSVWVVGDAEQIMQIPFAQSAGYLTYGSDVYGNATHAPSIYQYFNRTNKCCPVGGSQPDNRPVDMTRKTDGTGQIDGPR